MLLPLMLSFLGFIHGVTITHFLHTEIQDGMPVLDVHFARPMQAIKTY